MTGGLSDDTVEKIRTLLRGHSEIDTAILHGSRAMGTHRNGSDIDLTLTGPDLTQRVLFTLLDEIDDLMFPYTFDVSIRDSKLNPALLDHIRRVGVVIYDRHGDASGATAIEENGKRIMPAGNR